MRTTRSRVSAAVACVLAALSLTALAWSRPPEPDPLPKRWQLDIDIGPLRVASVEIPGQQPAVYYYMTYRVTNNSGQDLQFAPVFELGTDEGELFRAGRDVPRAVRLELLDRLNNPLLEDEIALLGTLLQGKENARDGLVVWPVGDMDVDEISVYAAGFSGETARIELKDPETGQPREIVLRKTFMVRYQLAGSLQMRGSEPIRPREQRWIMR